MLYFVKERGYLMVNDWSAGAMSSSRFEVPHKQIFVSRFAPKLKLVNVPAEPDPPKQDQFKIIPLFL